MTNPSTAPATQDAPPAFDLYDQGLQADVANLIDRRRVLQLIEPRGCRRVPRRLRARRRLVGHRLAAASAASSSTAGEACAP